MAIILPFGEHHPQVDESAWVAPNATIVGQVTIGANASVFYGAVVRGDMAAIEVGPGSNLQDNVIVHTDFGVPARIGANVGVGHGAIVHGAEVGDGALIGMGAILLNNARIGPGAFVAAGALVREGQAVPAGHLVAGVPAKDRGPLDDAAAARVKRNAHDYQALSKAHRAATTAAASSARLLQ